LDFKKVLTIEKDREYWMCGKIEVALDTIKELGTFVEAEAKGDFKDEKEAKKECIKFLENLGIKNVAKTYINKGYSALLFEKMN
jgi:predicted adenylyl cyclase CyaB